MSYRCDTHPDAPSVVVITTLEDGDTLTPCAQCFPELVATMAAAVLPPPFFLEAAAQIERFGTLETPDPSDAPPGVVASVPDETSGDESDEDDAADAAGPEGPTQPTSIPGPPADPAPGDGDPSEEGTEAESEPGFESSTIARALADENAPEPAPAQA